MKKLERLKKLSAASLEHFEKPAKHGKYYRAEDAKGRKVGQKTTVQYGVDMEELDPELKGFYGFHFGDAKSWIEILIRDGYIQDDEIAIIEVTLLNPKDFHEVDDFRIVDATSTPHSVIVFGPSKTLPGKVVEIVNRVEHDPFEKEIRDMIEYRTNDLKKHFFREMGGDEEEWESIYDETNGTVLDYDALREIADDFADGKYLGEL